MAQCFIFNLNHKVFLICCCPPCQRKKKNGTFLKSNSEKKWNLVVCRIPFPPPHPCFSIRSVLFLLFFFFQKQRNVYVCFQLVVASLQLLVCSSSSFHCAVVNKLPLCCKLELSFAWETVKGGWQNGIVKARLLGNQFRGQRFHYSIHLYYTVKPVKAKKLCISVYRHTLQMVQH